MASDPFTGADQAPLAAPWGPLGSFDTCRRLSNSVQNSSGSDTSSGCIYGSSTVADSQWKYISGTTDGGPGTELGPGPDGNITTGYDATRVYIYRLDDGGFTYVADALGVYAAGQPVRQRRSGTNLIVSVAGVDLVTGNDATYTGTGKPGGFFYAGNLVMDDWTDGVAEDTLIGQFIT